MVPTARMRAPGAPTTVLVVDDHALLRSVIVQVLADDGLDALEASTGDVGLRMAEQQQPDVILLDLAMPGRPGLEVLAALQQQVTTRDIPVLVMSGFSTLLESDQARCAQAAVPKPFELEAVVSLIRHHGAQRRAHLRDTPAWSARDGTTTP